MTKQVRHKSKSTGLLAEYRHNIIRKVISVCCDETIDVINSTAGEMLNAKMKTTLLRGFKETGKGLKKRLCLFFFQVMDTFETMEILIQRGKAGKFTAMITYELRNIA